VARVAARVAVAKGEVKVERKRRKMKQGLLELTKPDMVQMMVETPALEAKGKVEVQEEHLTEVEVVAMEVLPVRAEVVRMMVAKAGAEVHVEDAEDVEDEEGEQDEAAGGLGEVVEGMNSPFQRTPLSIQRRWPHITHHYYY
jgi:hypothetical protein